MNSRRSGKSGIKPEFSIIIPTFNSEKLIELCLDSITNQNIKDYEIIIIDGGSTDRTADIIEQKLHDHPNWKFISEPDKGIYDAMNKGMHLTRGNWLFFMGSDDTLYASDTLEKVKECISENVDFLYGNVLHKQSNKIVDGEFDTGKLFQKTICHQAIFYNKKLCDSVGTYNLDYKICSDWEYNLRCFARTSKIKHINQIICNYDGSGVSSFTTDNLFVENKYKIIKNIFKKNLTDKIFRPCRYDFLRYYLNSKAARNWRNALRYWSIFAYHSANEKISAFRKKY